MPRRTATKAVADTCKKHGITAATEAQVAAVEQYIARTETAAAVSDTELRPAFANLVRATGDVTKAQELMTVALDVAAGTGKDLETVTEALQEAFQGEVGPLQAEVGGGTAGGCEGEMLGGGSSERVGVDVDEEEAGGIIIVVGAGGARTPPVPG